MIVDDSSLFQLIAVFLPLSLLSVGGGQSVVADINNQVVQLHHWMTQAEFVDLFAISRAAPGPGSLLATLIGWKVHGIAGAIVATLAFFIPSSLITFAASVAWNRQRNSVWYGAIERGLTPIASGLILAGAYSVLVSASSSASLWIIAALTAGIFATFPRINPLLILSLAGICQVSLHALI
jgi:chromate transporter